MKRTRLEVATRIAVMVVCLMLGLWRPAQAATLTVTNTNDSGPGSLRQAIADAVSGDTIDFALDGCPCAVPTPGGQILIDKSLTIQGPGAHLLTLGAGLHTRLFAVAAGDVAITGLRMTGGAFGSQSGMAVLVEQTARLTLRRVLMANGGTNTIGGAVYNAGTLTVVDSVFTGNDGSAGGGGIYSARGGLTIQSTTFVSNRSARRGGAVYVQGGTALIVDSTFSGNVAGAANVESAIVTVRASSTAKPPPEMKSATLSVKLLHDGVDDRCAGDVGGHTATLIQHDSAVAYRRVGGEAGRDAAALRSRIATDGGIHHLQ